MVISSMSLLFLLVLSFNKEWIQKKKKVKLTFLKLFDNTLSKYAILKELIGCMAVLGYLPKLKRDLGLAFGAHFLHDFSIKFFPI